MFVALEEKNLKRFTGSIKKDFATDSDKMSESSLSNDEDSKAVQDGRWTRDEHHSFLKAMAIYGREWKLVQTAVMTRTSAQVRSHAQKYFQKCARQEPSNLIPGVAEDAFVVLELCERVLKTLKKKRDDYNIANSIITEDSDHEGSTENDLASDNNSLSSSSSVNTTNHSVYSFSYPLGQESTTLRRDEMIALEFLCCNKEYNYSPVSKNRKSLYEEDINRSDSFDSLPNSEKVLDKNYKSQNQSYNHNIQYKESIIDENPTKRIKAL